jgi:DNA end-binding protein Ku
LAAATARALIHDELRAADFEVLRVKVTLSPEMLKAAKTLVESMFGEFDPTDEQYVDTCSVATAELIDSKAAGLSMTVREESEATEEVSDLLAALQASIDKHPAGKSKRAPAKRAPAKPRVRKVA